MKKLSMVPGIPAPPMGKKAKSPEFDWSRFVADPERDIQPAPDTPAAPEEAGQAPDRVTQGLAGAGAGGLLGAGGLAGLSTAGKIPWPKVRGDLFRLAKREMGAEATPLTMSMLGRGRQVSKALRGTIGEQRLAGKTLSGGRVNKLIREILGRSGLRHTKPRASMFGKFLRGAMKHTRQPGALRRIGELARRASARLGTGGKLMALGIPAALLGGLGLARGGKKPKGDGGEK